VIRLINNTLTAADSAAKKLDPGSQHATDADQTAQKMRAVVFKLQFYPIILVFIWIFALINRLYESFSGGKQVFALFLLQKALSSSQGALNALVYGLSPEVRAVIRDLFAPMCPVCCDRGDAYERKVLSGSENRRSTNRSRLEDELDAEAGIRGGGRGGIGYQDGPGSGVVFQPQRAESFANPSDLDAVLDGEDDGIGIISPVVGAQAAAASMLSAGDGGSTRPSEVEMANTSGVNAEPQPSSWFG